MNITDSPIYLDCDPGIDDAVAIAILLRSEPQRLVGIGTVSGNVDAVAGAGNAMRVLSLAERRDVPVAVGHLAPLRGSYPGGFPQVHAPDGLGGIDVHRDPPCHSHEGAVPMLLRLAREHHGRLTLIAIGPLTNIAAALEIEPRLPAMVEELLIMGGAYAVSGNVTATAEANIWGDAEAADRVLSSGMKVVLVPLDVTMQHTLGLEDLQQLAESNDALAKSLGQMLRYYAAQHAGQFEQLAAPLHDSLAAGIAVGLVEVLDEAIVPLRVQLTGETRGALIPNVEPTAAKVRVVLQVGSDTVARIRDTLIEQESVADG